MLYIKKLKNLTKINNQYEFALNSYIISEENFSDNSDDFYNSKFGHKKSIKTKNTVNKLSKNIEDEKEEMNNLILIYKYLKNLYLSLEDDKTGL